MDQVARVEPTLAQQDAVAQPELKTFSFQFTGEVGEYFRIWIVNVALTVLSLGIYSAWATVRTRRYFYAHTRLAEVPFEYSARPLPILIGRIIAVAVLAMYILSEYLFPLAMPFIVLAVAVLVPILVVRSMRFRARYSSWHGCRFRFAGSYGDAYKYYLFSYLLVIVSLGLLYPLVKAWQKEYIVANHLFGECRFRVESLRSPFYNAYVKAWFMAFGLIAVVFIVLVPVSMMAMGTGESEDETFFFTFTIAAMIGIYGGLFLIGMFIYTRITNAMYAHAGLEAFNFTSILSARHLAWLYFSNTLAIIATIGMAIPWARVRVARYRASCLSVSGPDDFTRFQSGPAGAERAIGAELGEVFEVEVGF